MSDETIEARVARLETENASLKDEIAGLKKLGELNPHYFQRMLQALAQAGWATDTRLLVKENSHPPISWTMSITKGGGERFRALLFLLNDLESKAGCLNPIELGHLWRAAISFAPNPEKVFWPSQLSSLIIPPSRG